MLASTPAQHGTKAALIAGRAFDTIWYIVAALTILIAFSAYSAASAANTVPAVAITASAPAFGHLSTTTGTGGNAVAGSNLGGTVTGSGGSATSAK